MTGPMQGVKVVEMGVWVAGPAAGGILADWGADVVKIEPPGVGDPGRLFTKMIGGDLPFNPPFEMDNRGKRSIVLDLASAPAREVALELIDGADVFLSNMRTSALERLGLDSASLLARNPRLVYASVTGYGMEGPDADRAAYDIAAFWSRSGVAASLTAPGGGGGRELISRRTLLAVAASQTPHGSGGAAAVPAGRHGRSQCWLVGGGGHFRGTL